MSNFLILIQMTIFRIYDIDIRVPLSVTSDCLDRGMHVGVAVL